MTSMQLTPEAIQIVKGRPVGGEGDHAVFQVSLFSTLLLSKAKRAATCVLVILWADGGLG